MLSFANAGRQAFSKTLPSLLPFVGGLSKGNSGFVFQAMVEVIFIWPVNDWPAWVEWALGGSRAGHRA